MSDVADDDQNRTKEPMPKGICPAEQAKPPEQHAHADKRKHTWLEIFAVFFAALAFVASAWQGWVARDSEQRSLRAYVFAENTNIGITNDRKPNITVTIKNVGATPAYEFRHWACAFVRPTPNPTISWNVFPDISKGIEAPETIVAPQGVKLKIIDGWCESPFRISDAERNEIKSGVKSVYAIGKITYKDTFGAQRITRYSRYWNDILGSAANDDKEGNCADEYCLQ